ncbi:hypothetical protein NAT47_09065 [Flavobacterium sp. HXWNR69]|uniref:Uncharacterized protein n=1 Tax=Flavobacterium fragile TaxID=2949085 RepID=A0ABT0TI98_9FLAO|nr:hypothetical protein [Flavobacterium sp. HXWNR69]MCL9770568.1 hypothetical protein [Flavobacterium sp. HXWNR69]
MISNLITSFLQKLGFSKTNPKNNPADELKAIWEHTYTSYESAIKKNCITDFYFGKNDYFHPDREYPGHQFYKSFASIKEYINKYGNKGEESFKKDILFLLNQKLSFEEFFYVMGYIHLYCYAYCNENAQNASWLNEKEIKQLVNKNFSSFSKLDIEKDKNGNFYNFHLISYIDRIKKITGINLTDLENEKI